MGPVSAFALEIWKPFDLEFHEVLSVHSGHIYSFVLHKEIRKEECCKQASPLLHKNVCYNVYLKKKTLFF